MSVRRPPLALFTAGGPGVGKSHVLRLLLPQLPLVSLDCDDIQDALWQEELWRRDPAVDRAALRPRAIDLLEQRQEKLIAERRDLVVNTTAADLPWLTGLHARFRAAGYRCALLFVHAGLAEALARNEARPHPVPEEEVRRKHQQVLANRAALLALFDPCWEVDNGAGSPPLADRIAPIRASLISLLGAGAAGG